MTSETEPLDTTAPNSYKDARKPCDLVMKGGITSGVIYPQAVLALAKNYCFRSIGGTSAGAIAAAMTAAAEYGRKQKQADSDQQWAGFVLMENEIIPQLTTEGFIRGLFQPAPATQPLLDGLLTYRRRQHAREQRAATRHQPPRTHSGSLRARIWDAVATLWETAAKAPWGPLKRSTFWGLVGSALIAVLLSAAALLANNAFVAVILLVLAIAAVVLGYLIGSVVGVLNLLANDVPGQHFYGICTGMGNDTALTNWLADTIDRLAGLPSRKTPLTFRQLAMNHQSDDQAPFDLTQTITLNMVTTNLSQGQPYTLPFTSGPFLFSKQEFERLFPHYIVEYMTTISEAYPPTDITQQSIQVMVPHGEDQYRPLKDREPSETHDLYFLPRGLDLPVVVATRMSLSFPLLLSAVPLWTLNEACLRRYTDGNTITLAAGDLQRNWFSDGGTCSNFPIHFYDRWFPNHPTFGINLETVPDELLEKKGKLPSGLTPKMLEYRSIIRPEPPDQPREATQPWKVFRNVPPLNENAFKHLVHLPKPFPQERPLPRWEPLGGELGSFVWSIINTGLFYRDTVQARLPSYYDRIVTIYQGEHEGGLNLDMEKEVIQDIAERGGKAGEQLLNFNFDLHRWVRLRLLLAEMEDQLFHLRGSVLSKGQDANGAPPVQSPASTQLASAPQLEGNDEQIQSCLKALRDLIVKDGRDKHAVEDHLFQLCGSVLFEDENASETPSPRPPAASQSTHSPRLDWHDRWVDISLRRLRKAIEDAGLGKNAVRDIIEHQRKLTANEIPYWVGDHWSKDDDFAASYRFLLLQLLLEMWVQQDIKGKDLRVFRDENAPARNNMSMRVAPDL